MQGMTGANPMRAYQGMSGGMNGDVAFQMPNLPGASGMEYRTPSLARDRKAIELFTGSTGPRSQGIDTQYVNNANPVVAGRGSMAPRTTQAAPIAPVSPAPIMSSPGTGAANPALASTWRPPAQQPTSNMASLLANAGQKMTSAAQGAIGGGFTQLTPQASSYTAAPTANVYNAADPERALRMMRGY